jgi:hypothetical protein
VLSEGVKSKNNTTIKQALLETVCDKKIKEEEKNKCHIA